LQLAVRAEVRRLELLAETDKYLAELVSHVGKPSARNRAKAAAIVRQIPRIALRIIEPSLARLSYLPYTPSFAERVQPCLRSKTIRPRTARHALSADSDGLRPTQTLRRTAMEIGGVRREP
jgi:hypothetical protein